MGDIQAFAWIVLGSLCLAIGIDWDLWRLAFIVVAVWIFVRVYLDREQHTGGGDR